MKKGLLVFLFFLFIVVGFNYERIFEVNTCVKADGNFCEYIHKQISKEEARILIEEKEELVIIDVRTLEEYNEGHISGALLFPDKRLVLDKEVLEQYKEKPVLVYCRTKNRAIPAAQQLKQWGFIEVYTMVDGYSTWNY
jgi:rhodanese-related sulfurtransferase